MESTSPYNSPLWAVRKKFVHGEEKYRVVVDFRKLNENTMEEKYSIPRFEDILDKLSGATIFNTLYLKGGYHQIRMQPRDQHKTAFSFEKGHYGFTRRPFGLKPSAENSNLGKEKITFLGHSISREWNKKWQAR